MVSIHPPRPTDLIRKQPDPTHVTVDSGFWSPKPNFNGLVGDSLHWNPIQLTRPIPPPKGCWYLPFEEFLSQISSNSVRSCIDQASQTRPIFTQICQIFDQISANCHPMKNWPIWPNSLTDWQRVWKMSTQLGRVSCRLGQTWPGLTRGHLDYQPSPSLSLLTSNLERSQPNLSRSLWVLVRSR